MKYLIFLPITLLSFGVAFGQNMDAQWAKPSADVGVPAVGDTSKGVGIVCGGDGHCYH